MADITIADLTLTDADFDTEVTTKMTRALFTLITYLGSAIFDPDDQNRFHTNVTAERICRILQEHPDKSEEKIDEETALLVAALGRAYDVYVEIVENSTEEILRGIP